MHHKTNISTICPVLNEEGFIEAHIQNCLRFSERIVYADTGCTDRTTSVIRQYQTSYPGRIVLLNLSHLAEGAYDWLEGIIRNSLISECDTEWICNLDADELWPDEFFEALPNLVQTRKNFIRFTQYAFWNSAWTIRLRQPERYNWRTFYPAGRQYRLFRNSPHVRYAREGNHAHLELYNLGKWSPRLSKRDVDIPFFHYHWARGLKEGDNRAWEQNRTGVRLMTYFDRHPREAELYDFFRGE